MIVGMQQPYLFPYLGYWQMVNAVDTFLIADDAHMIQYGWLHQNRLLQRGGEPLWFRLHLEKKHSAYMKPICQVELIKDAKIRWNINIKETLRHNYVKAPYYEETMALIEPLLNPDETHLADYLAHQIRAVAQHLGMRTNIVRGCEVMLPEEYNLHVMEKIALLRDRLGFDTWLSLSNGAHYYTKEQMAAIGIDIRFHHIDPSISYQQIGRNHGEPFEPNLSIIDVLMNCGREGTKQLLDKYTVT